MTLFAFDLGQELSEHTAPFDALVHVLDGEVEIRISGKPFTLKAGEAIIMPANEPHAVKALTEVQNAPDHDQGIDQPVFQDIKKRRQKFCRRFDFTIPS